MFPSLKVEDEPKVLSLDDLAFGFNIWLRACLASIVGFIAELIWKLLKTRRKIKFAKVHPVLDEVSISKSFKNLSPELVEKFRINTNLQNVEADDMVEVVFGEKIEFISAKIKDNESKSKELLLVDVLNAIHDELTAVKIEE